MKTPRFVILFLMVGCAFAAAAQRVTDVYAPLSADFQTTYVRPPMYGAAVHQIGPATDGVIGMFTHGNSLGYVPGDTGVDSLYRWRRAASGQWSTSGGGITPSMYDQFPAGEGMISKGAHPQFQEPLNMPFTGVCGATYQDPQGIFGVPETAVVGNKLYMAYLKGNADGYTGEVHWAVSSVSSNSPLGRNWTKMPNPLIWAPNHRGHRSDGTPSCIEGIGEFAMLVTTDPSTGQKWFNIYGMWHHPNREVTNGDFSPVHYRIKYSSTNTYGLDLTSGQLWYNGAWMPHNGRLFWAHDGAAPPGDVAVNRTLVKATWENYGSYRNIRVASSATSKAYSSTSFAYFMIVEGYYPDQPWTFNNHLLVTSDDGLNWSQPTPIDVTAIRNIYGSGPALVHNSIFYGTIGTSSPPPNNRLTGFWGFFSLGNQCPGDPYQGVYCGTRILPVKLEIPEWK